MSFLPPPRKVVALAALTSSVVAALAASPATAATQASPASLDAPAVSRAAAPAASTWFVDPRTPAQRKAELPVPANPKKYSGTMRETQAVYRTRDGDLAVPMGYAVGHKVAKGQALTLDGQSLFVVNSTTLTKAARTQLRQTATSLSDAASIRCEGYADYAGAAKHNRSLARDRAERVCDTLADLAPGLRTTAVGYGDDRPAIVGGTTPKRDLNRRVVVEMLSARTVAGPRVTAPGAPTLVELWTEPGAVQFAFEAPASNGGSPITSYQYSTGSTWTTFTPTDDLVLSRIQSRQCRSCDTYLYGRLTGLADGATLTLRVRAVNRVGAGAASTTRTFVNVVRASAPTGLATTGVDGVITAVFGPVTRTGGTAVQRYEISYDGGDTWFTVDTTGPAPWTATRNGFSNGSTREVLVRAVTSSGNGATAWVSTLVATTPGAPSIAAPVIDGTTGTVSFTAPSSNGGAPVTRYEISTDEGLTWGLFPYEPTGPGTFRSVLSDLSYGDTTSVSIRAVNARGHGPASNLVGFTATTVPDAPTDLVATASGSSVGLAFDEPTFDGGSEITAYEVKVDDGSWHPLGLSGVPGHRITATLAGQVAGTHTYAVRAVNNQGASAAVSASATIAGMVPDAPSINYVGYYGAGQSWVVLFSPGDGHGETITGYEVSVDGGAWRSADSFTASQAIFSCPGMSCGWAYEDDIRLRTVSTGGTSAPSDTYFGRPM